MSGDNPSIADLAGDGRRLPSEIAREKLSTSMRIYVARQFFEKVGFRVERVLEKTDGTVQFTVRPS